jgi:hypothetical protein
MGRKNKGETRREELERRLADLHARMPAHSIPPAMMIALDELEEQLAELDNRSKDDRLENEERP